MLLSFVCISSFSSETQVLTASLIAGTALQNIDFTSGLLLYHLYTQLKFAKKIVNPPIISSYKFNKSNFRVIDEFRFKQNAHDNINAKDDDQLQLRENEYKKYNFNHNIDTVFVNPPIV